MNWQDLDVKAIGGLGVGGILTAFVVWVRGSKARRDVSRDSVDVREDESRKDWLETIESRYRTEVALREASEARERACFAELQAETRARHTVELQLAFEREHNERLSDRNRQLVRVVRQDRPELVPWLESSPMDLGPVEIQPPSSPTGQDRKP